MQGLALTDDTHCAYIDPASRCSILGVGQVAAQVKNAAVVVHGPKGCLYPVYEATLQSNFPYNYTEMCESSVVFGNEEVIRDKILDTYYDNAPSLIVVVTTCSSEIIGDDVDGVIYSLKEEIACPIVKVEGVGFKKNHAESVPHAMGVITEHLARPACCSKQPAPDINLIPHIGTTSRWKDEANAVRQLLEEAGYTVNLLFCDSETTALADAGRAKLNVCINSEVGEPLAKQLEQTFGTPYLAPVLPIGLENCVHFMDNVDHFFSRNNHQRYDDLADTTRTYFRAALGKMANLNPLELAQRSATAVIGDKEQVSAYMHTLSRELGITPCLAIIKATELDKDHIQALADEYRDCRFVCTDDNMVIKKELTAVKPAILLANDFEYQLCKTFCEPSYINISYPGARMIRMREEYHVGFKGVLILAEQIINAVIQMRF
ncbi:nitrogenase component 1 [Photobacterium lutimaris]|uniref:Nitrogenase/oxidoreductase component 1 domain-containing protein n=1 Tax=Photobacterium lutimaris TaxID=388278 RepID=A0A2T3J337_9GAMM|nr:nitrogenase component 1 [Photobacterium lutimaris]PSU35717.1 hypothetical protein C9I99_01480 [Photobacterium lutimaris]TDR78779.1 nitrogenase molybdenum-iron protein beta chain [Photobacterium lutimaris]